MSFCSWDMSGLMTIFLGSKFLLERTLTTSIALVNLARIGCGQERFSLYLPSLKQSLIEEAMLDSSLFRTVEMFDRSF